MIQTCCASQGKVPSRVLVGGILLKKKNVARRKHHQNSHMTQQPRRRCIKASSHLRMFFLLACKNVMCCLTVLLTKSALVQRLWPVCACVFLQQRPRDHHPEPKKQLWVSSDHAIPYAGMQAYKRHFFLQIILVMSSEPAGLIRSFSQAKAWDSIYTGFWDRVEGSEVHCAPTPHPPPPSSPQSNTALNVLWNRTK